MKTQFDMKNYQKHNWKKAWRVEYTKGEKLTEIGFFEFFEKCMSP